MVRGLKVFLFLIIERLRQLLTKLGVSVPDVAAAAAEPEAAAAAAQRADGVAEIMVAVCYTAAIDIAVMSLQIHSQLPISFFLVLLAVLFAFSSFLISKFLSKFRKAARVLDRAGVFFAVTGFFIAISIPFPLCLQIITWTVYSICLFVVVLCNYFFV
ncbi:hypothetical protein TIFTF001_023339 [Ficus carica]|uniref:Uncharacterized protein n=1 Tax=Ficus carica TaxID=3494 RepID=A0AA88DG68_FICCA|nr:hypothetical protein TIFTF001_023339 [Ficus carica]